MLFTQRNQDVKKTEIYNVDIVWNGIFQKLRKKNLYWVGDARSREWKRKKIKNLKS